GFIIKLFLLESVFQGLAGTLLGIILGVAMSLGIASITWGGDAFVSLSWLSVLSIAGVAVLVGVTLTVVGTLLPAWQAAKMQPIDAMRTDV
ncbi:MAG: FtsX-like permease family protein, partial [Planctomycetota bacterium]